MAKIRSTKEHADSQADGLATARDLADHLDKLLNAPLEMDDQTHRDWLVDTLTHARQASGVIRQLCERIEELQGQKAKRHALYPISFLLTEGELSEKDKRKFRQWWKENQC